jgi:hypothetical protein
MFKPLFDSGRIVATQGALDAIRQVEGDMGVGLEYINRHLKGDWGELCDEDVKENEYSLEHGLRLMSVYTLPTGVKIWIITEADRSATTILLPEEY